METAQKNAAKPTDEIGEQLESGNEVNATLQQQGEAATEGIPRDTDAAKHNPDNDDNRELTGAP